MPDKLSPEVTIVLDKERRLKFGLRAMRAFEKETGKNLLTAKGLSEFNATELSVLLWACLLHEDKALTLEDAISLFDNYGNLQVVAQKLMAAQNAAMSEGDGEVPLAGNPRGGTG